MKIVHVCDFVHPDAGYELNQLSRLQAKDGHDVTIVTAELAHAPSHLTQFFGIENIPERDERFRHETGVRIVRLPVYGYFSGRALFKLGLFRTVKRLQPDVVLIHCEDSLTGIQFAWCSPFLSYPIVLDSHSLEMGSMNRFRGVFRAFYKNFVAPVIVRRRIPLIRLVDSDYVEACLGIPLAHTILLSFGTDTDLFRPAPPSASALRRQLNIREDAFVVMYAGKLNEHKGGRFLAEALQAKVKASKGRDLVFLIVGSTDGSYGKQVEETFSKSENAIIRLPTQRYLDLAKIYQASNLALFPKQCSMSFFEVQSCGLPVLFELNEINSQRARYDNGLLFAPEDVADFRSKLQQLIDMPEEQFQHMRVRAREYVLGSYDYVPIARKFTEVLREAHERFAIERGRRSGS